MWTYASFAAFITGTVKDEQGNPLGFTNILVEKSSLGTVANEEGKFSLRVSPGNYTLIIRAIGFASKSIPVSISDKDINIEIILAESSMELPEVEKKANANDPADAIMKKAIEQKDKLNKGIKGYQCNVYIKGAQKV